MTNIKVGKIVSASLMPWAPHLFLMQVDIGNRVIQVVNGFNDCYNALDLKEKIVLVNLLDEPIKICGEFSRGNILTAIDEDTNEVSLVSPDKPIVVGSDVV